VGGEEGLQKTEQESSFSAETTIKLSEF